MRSMLAILGSSSGVTYVRKRELCVGYLAEVMERVAGQRNGLMLLTRLRIDMLYNLYNTELPSSHSTRRRR
jgi:hypothetical protein